MDDFSRLRAEIKADNELTLGMMTDMGKRLDERIDQVEIDAQNFRREVSASIGGLQGALLEVQTSLRKAQADVVVVQAAVTVLARTMELQHSQMATSLEQFRQSLREHVRLITGRMWLSSERFDSMLEVIEQRLQASASQADLRSIDDRLKALEQEQDPAA